MSESEITKHVKSGELCLMGLDYSCNICSNALGRNPLPHIQSATHKNAAFLQTLSQPFKYEALYSSLPKVIQDAHRKGLVTANGSNVECGLCKVSLSGVKPLTDHLCSSKHLTKAAGSAPQGRVQGPSSSPSAGPSSAKPTFDYVNDSVSFGQRDPRTSNLIHPVVACAISNGHVKALGATDFQCTLCQGAGVMTGTEPMRQHLEGKPHQKKVKEHQLQEASQRAVASPKQQPFNMGGLIQNISVIVQPVNNYGQCPVATNPRYYSDAGVPPSSMRQAEEKGPAQPSKVYKNDSSPRGIVVIFNYIIFENDPGNLRTGARKDHEKLQAVFSKMGYEVWPTNTDLTRQNTLKKLDEIRNSPELGKVDSLITVFLSHGGTSAEEFCTSDKSSISVEEIIYTYFTDKECPLMKGKPKLFIFNYCRGNVIPSNPVEYDSWNPSTRKLEAPVDVAIIQATLPHFKAGRYSDTGTIFVTEFCKVLDQNSKNMELTEIVHETSIQMKKDSQGNTPTIQPIHFGKFKFM